MYYHNRMREFHIFATHGYRRACDPILSKLRLERTKAVKGGMRLLRATAIVSASVWAQEPGYPITVVPPGKGPYQFPQGYQTPWEKIEMLVTEKLAANLYSLHGSSGLDPTHPDGGGGRVAVLFGPDGVL